MDKQNNEKIANKVIVTLHPHLENLLFDKLYDCFISETDTDQLIENISVENLESFLYQTAKYFYSCRLSATQAKQ